MLMSNSCPLFINNPSDVSIKRAIGAYLKDISKDGEQVKSPISYFDKIINKDEIEGLTNFKLTNALSDNTVQQAIVTFSTILDNVINQLKTNPRLTDEQRAALINLKANILEELKVELDETQTGNTQQDSSSNDTTLLDENIANLSKHLNAIYGEGAYRTIEELNNQFTTDITKCAWIDMSTGQTIFRTNDTLNKNIRQLKLQYANDIVTYLKSIDTDKYGQLTADIYDANGNFNSSIYYALLHKFYEVLKNTPDLVRTLDVLPTKGGNVQNIVSNNNQYQHLIDALLTTNADFNKWFNNKFRSESARNSAHCLYEAGKVTRSFNIIKEKINRDFNLVKIGNSKITDILNGFTLKANNLLIATNAYTCLTHFDEMLRAQFGMDIDIAKGLFGIEPTKGNKYLYKQDTSHQKQGWEQSENIQSESYVAKQLEKIMQQIDLYSYETKEYQNRTVTVTDAITSLHNFMDDIIFGNISTINWAEGDRRLQILNRLNNYIYNFHDNPNVYVQKILEDLFTSDLAERFPVNRNSLTNKINLDTLYSLYKTVYDKGDPNSIISQEISRQMESLGPITSITQEISGLIDRNMPVYYTEVTFEGDETIVKTKKRYFTNLDERSLQNKINMTTNQHSLEEAQKLSSNFEVKSGTKGYIYIQNFSDFSITYNSEQILFKNAAGNFKKESKSIFDEFKKIDLGAFRWKVLNKSELTDTERKFTELLHFIDDQLNLNIFKQPETILQQLYIFNQLDSNNIQELTKLAMRAAFVNKLKADAGDQYLLNYLEDGNKYKLYSLYKSDPENTLFSQHFNNLFISVVPFADKTVAEWCRAYATISNKANKATTKNNEGSSIANNSVATLGNQIISELSKQKMTNADSLYFVQNTHNIKLIQRDLEATTMWGKSKQVKNFSAKELFYHSIFNKFFGAYLSKGNLIVQPTIYSDKTTFINYEIAPTLFNNIDILKDSDYRDTILKQTINTIGAYYTNIYNNNQAKLNTLFNEFIKVNSAENIKDMLWQMNELQLINFANKLGINLEKDLDYRVIKGNDGKKHCVINEQLDYNANYLYSNVDNLSDFLERQKQEFVNNLIDTDSTFQVVDYNDDYNNYLAEKLPTKRGSKNPIINTILKLYKGEARQEFFKNWVDASTGRLIIAKDSKGNIVSDTVSNNIELNPLLDKFFYIEGFISNNLRMSLTGNELNHPDKSRDTLYSLIKAGKDVDGIDSNIATLIQNTKSVADLRTLKAKSKKDQKLINYVYQESLLKMINVSQGTQFKRNVIIPATLQYCEQNTLNGISKNIRCAVIYDEPSPVFNYRGSHEGSIDSADGSAKITPFQSILENKSLGTQAVGLVRKPIWHAYNSENGSAFLAKFATDTITNNTMRMSLASKTSLYKLFKQMTNIQWQGDVNLTEGLFTGIMGNNPNKEAALINFWNTCILGNTSSEGENKLYYKDNYGTIKKIDGIDYEEVNGFKIYFTEESDKINGISNVVTHKQYHIFDNNSIHHVFNTIEEAMDFVNSNVGAHTINSLFELHAALGGLNCVDSEGNYSEFVNSVVVNFMNNIGRLKGDKTILDQDNYEQPLKKYHIGYALNNTAVKNGAQNINSSDAWHGDIPLHSFNVSSAGLGMQLNADHDVVNSELTEFSQVITATAAYGFTADNTEEIFKGLAKASISKTEELSKSVDKFLSENTNNPEQAKSDLYTAIGKIILTSSSIKDRESLQHIIIQAVSRVLYKNKNHTNDETKIPFSDPNIYSDFIATLTSTINKEAIKRKHPGSADVMAAAYNMIQYYEFDGQKYTTEGVLKKARADMEQDVLAKLATLEGWDSKTKNFKGTSYFIATTQELAKLAVDNGLQLKYNITTQDAQEFNIQLLKTYIESKQNDSKYIKDLAWFMPSDNVDIIDENGVIVGSVDLDNLNTYYHFKNGLTTIEATQHCIIEQNGNQYTISKDGKVANMILNDDGKWVLDTTELSAIAAMIKGSVIVPAIMDANGNIIDESKEVFSDRPIVTYRENITRPHNLRPSTIRWQDSKTDQWFNIFDTYALKTAYENNEPNPQAAQKELNLIYAGKYTDSNGVEHEIKEGSLQNEAAELISSNLYKEKFNIGNEELSEILEQGEDYFYNKFNKIRIPLGSNYDIAFIKDSGSHTLIKIGNLVQNEFIQENDFNNNELITNEKDEIYYIKNKEEQFKVGKWVDVDNVMYSNGSFMDKNSKQILPNDLYRLKDPNDVTSVQKKYVYVTRYIYINKKTSSNGKEYYNRDTLYNIAPLSTFTAALKSNEGAKNQQGDIISAIYLHDDFKLAQLNNNVLDANTLSTAYLALARFRHNELISQDIKDLLEEQNSSIATLALKYTKNMSEEVKTAYLKEITETKAKNRKSYKELLDAFLHKQAHKKYISFLDAQYFIASRIPAQSLQSFMAMKNIAWTGTTSNIAYVSHFQTYLQGSDYTFRHFSLS